MYEGRGLDAVLARRVAQGLTAHDALGAHARDELGISDTTSARPSASFWSSTCIPTHHCVKPGFGDMTQYGLKLAGSINMQLDVDRVSGSARETSTELAVESVRNRLGHRPRQEPALRGLEPTPPPPRSPADDPDGR